MISSINEFLTNGKAIVYTKENVDISDFKQLIEDSSNKVMNTQIQHNTQPIDKSKLQSNLQGANNTTPIDTTQQTTGLVSGIINVLNNIPPIDVSMI